MKLDFMLHYFEGQRSYIIRVIFEGLLPWSSFHFPCSPKGGRNCKHQIDYLVVGLSKYWLFLFLLQCTALILLFATYFSNILSVTVSRFWLLSYFATCLYIVPAISFTFVFLLIILSSQDWKARLKIPPPDTRFRTEVCYATRYYLFYIVNVILPSRF